MPRNRSLGRLFAQEAGKQLLNHWRDATHEFGHQCSGDHLSAKYHQALCGLGARLTRVALEKPEALRQFMR
jgi:hypothetical protein